MSCLNSTLLKRFATGGLALAAGVSAQAHAQALVDFVPRSLSIARTIGDDVNNDPVQSVRVMIRNGGTRAFTGTSQPVRIRIGTRVLSTYLYGPSGSGGFNLGARVAPGQEGMLVGYLPPDTLRHCSVQAVSIDLDRRLQAPLEAFLNDTARLRAIEAQNPRLCLILDPHPGVIGVDPNPPMGPLDEAEAEFGTEALLPIHSTTPSR